MRRGWGRRVEVGNMQCSSTERLWCQEPEMRWILVVKAGRSGATKIWYRGDAMVASCMNGLVECCHS